MSVRTQRHLQLPNCLAASRLLEAGLNRKKWRRAPWPGDLREGFGTDGVARGVSYKRNAVGIGMTNGCSVVAAVLWAIVGASLRDDALSSWERMREQRPTFVKLTCKRAYPQQEIVHDNRFEFGRRGENRRFAEDRDESHKGRRSREHNCWVVNDQYAFVVARASEQTGWMLKQVALRGTDDYQALVQRLDFLEATSAFGGLIVADAPLADIVANTECEFTDVEGDPLRCILTFRRKGERKFTSTFGFPFHPEKGAIVLNKEKGWVVESAELTHAGGSKVTETYRYDGETGAMPAEMLHKTDTGYRCVTVQELSFDKGFSESDFRLTAFGLPEPSGIPSTAPKKLWYVGIASVLLVFAGIWLMRRRR